MTRKYLTATFIGFLVAVTLLVLSNPALLDILT